MSDDPTVHTYTVILAPRDIPLDVATDVRTFDVALPTTLTDRQGRLDAVTEYIASEEPIDAWAFRKHWDISHVIRSDGSEADTLRDTIMGFDTVELAEDDEFTAQAIYLRDNDGSWVQSSLAVDPDVAESFRKWVNNFTGVHNRDVHEAMVEVLAAEHPRLPDALLDAPRKAHTELLELAMDHEDAIEDRLD